MKNKKIILLLISLMFFLNFIYAERGSVVIFAGNQWISDENIREIYGINFLRYGGELNINVFKSFGFFLKLSHQSQYGRTTYFKEETYIEMNPVFYGIKFGNRFFIKAGFLNMRFQEKSDISDYKDSTGGTYFGGGLRIPIIAPVSFSIEFGYAKADYSFKNSEGVETTIKLGGVSTDAGIVIRF